MSSVAQIEFGLASLVFVDNALAVGRSGFQRSIFLVDHYDIFIVKVHGRGFTGVPPIAPDNDAVGLEQLFDVRPWKRIWITRFVRKRRNRVILQLDHNGSRPVLNRRVALMAEDRGAFVGQGDGHEIVFRRRQRAGSVPDGDALVIDNRLGDLAKGSAA
jgi:hypothetical protein